MTAKKNYWLSTTFGNDETYTFEGATAVVPPSGSTAERPSTPINGSIRYNTTINAVEIYQNNAWVTIQVGTTTVNGSNVGGGEQIFKQLNISTLEFRTLIAGTNINLSAGDDTITISASSSGEANTASNIGSGTGRIYRQKINSNLEFRSLESTHNNLSITNIGDVVNFSFSDNPIFEGTDSITIPSGTVAQRSNSPSDGMIRYNTDNDRYEGYNDGVWREFLDTNDLMETTLVVNDINDFKMIDFTEAKYANSLSIIILEENRGGVFNLQLSGTDDGGITFASNDGLRYAVREFSGAINVKWFGAKGDGVTDDQPAIQAAVNAAEGVTDVFIPVGRYFVNAGIKVPPHVNVRGAGRDSTIIDADGSTGLFLDTGVFSFVGGGPTAIQDITSKTNRGSMMLDMATPLNVEKGATLLIMDETQIMHVSGITGTYQLGETITGSESGASGVILKITSVPNDVTKKIIHFRLNGSIQFQKNYDKPTATSDTITGNTNGAIGTCDWNGGSFNRYRWYYPKGEFTTFDFNGILVELQGTSGSINTLTINGNSIISGPINFVTNIVTTAQTLINNINATQSVYRATLNNTGTTSGGTPYAKVVISPIDPQHAIDNGLTPNITSTSLTTTAERKVFLTAPLYDEYDTWSKLYVVETTSSTISDITVRGRGRNYISIPVFFRYGSGGGAYRVKCENAPYTTLQPRQCYRMTFDDLDLKQDIWTGTASYGISIANCQTLRINNVRILAQRHAIAHGGFGFPLNPPCRDIVTSNSELTSSSQGTTPYSYDIHGNAEYCSIIDSTIRGACSIGGNNNRVDGCLILTEKSVGNPYCIHFGELVGPNMTVSNTIMRMTGVVYTSNTLATVITPEWMSWDGTLSFSNVECILDADIDTNSNLIQVRYPTKDYYLPKFSVHLSNVRQRHMDNNFRYLLEIINVTDNPFEDVIIEGCYVPNGGLIDSDTVRNVIINDNVSKNAVLRSISLGDLKDKCETIHIGNNTLYTPTLQGIYINGGSGVGRPDVNITGNSIIEAYTDSAPGAAGYIEASIYLRFCGQSFVNGNMFNSSQTNYETSVGLTSVTKMIWGNNVEIGGFFKPEGSPVVSASGPTAVLAGDADVTLDGTYQLVIYGLSISVERTVTLPTVGLYNGLTIKVVRTGSSGGAFNVVVKTSGGTTLTTLTTSSQWVELTWYGSNWLVSAKGTL